MEHGNGVSDRIDGRTSAWVNAWDLMAAAALIRNAAISADSEIPPLHDCYLDEATIYVQLANCAPEVTLAAWDYMIERFEQLKAESANEQRSTLSSFEDIIKGNGMMPEKKDEEQKPYGDNPVNGGDGE